MYRKLFLLILTAALLFTVGCRGKMAGGAFTTEAGYSTLSSRSMAAPMPAMADMSDLTEKDEALARETSAQYASIQNDGGDTGAPAGNYTDAERKLIKHANVSIRVDNLAVADDAVAAMLRKYEAYAAATNIEENARYYSLRIPVIYYEFFLSETGGLGRLITRYENTEDVTLRYYDLEGRLATKKELLKTFQAYLGKAKTIEEIMSVEARIMELQYDIDGTGKQLRNLADKVDYATIDLYLQGPVTAASLRSFTFGERVKQLFGGFGGFLSTLAMVLLGIVVYGIPILVILGLLFVLFFGKIGLAKKLWKLVKPN